MKRSSIVKNIAKAVAITGMAGMIIVAPNTAQAFDQLARINRKKFKKGYPDYLKRSGYFEYTQTDDKFVIKLTEKGWININKLEFDDYKFNLPKKWDKTWHLIMFDIPEKHRNNRIQIVRKLNELGMRQVQNSVYVHYAPTEELGSIIRERFPAVSTLVISATVNRIDGEDQLRKAFKI